jgi:TP901 family phage tail tape measure protein
MATAGELKFVITVDNKGAVKNITVMDSKMDKLDKGVKKTNKSMSGFAKTMRRAFVAAGIALAIKKTIDFNKEIALTATMMPNLDKEVNELKANVQDLAIRYGKSTIDMAKGSFLVVSAFGAQAAASKKLELTAKAAAAGNAETSASLSLLSAVTKGYGDTSDQAFQKASDLAFMTVKLGQTDFPALAASIGKVVPVAAAMNVKQEELFAGFATLTGVTGNAAEVSTQLSGILRAMIKPTEGMRAAIKELGFETAEQMIEQEGLIGSMRMLVENTDGTSESIGKLFRRAEALTAVFALTGGQADVFNEKFEKIKVSTGATDEALREVTDGVNKAGFSLEQTKQAFTVFTQRIVDSTLQSTQFDDALKGLKEAFENKAFIDAIANITSLLAKFVSNIVATIASISGLVDQAGKAQERFSSQADQWESDFDKIFSALRQAGLGFEEYNKIIATMESTQRIDELRESQKKLREEIEKQEDILSKAEVGIFGHTEAQANLTKATKELNNITAERNDLLVNQLHELVKNAEQHGVNASVIEKARKILRGQIDTQKKATDELDKNTKGLEDNAKELTEIEKIAKQYGVGLASATAILQAQKPELAKIAEIQESLNISLEEATKLYPILVKIEEERKENLKKTKDIFEEMPEAQELVNRNFREEIDLVPGLESVNTALIEGRKALEEESEAADEAAEKAKKLAKELLGLEKNLNFVINALRSLAGLSFVPDTLATAFAGFGDVIANVASGNVLGALTSGLNTLTDLFGKDGLTGGIELAAEALRKFGITGQKEIDELTKKLEDMAKSWDISDLLDAEDAFKKLQDEADKTAEEMAKSTSQWFEPIRDIIPDLEKFLQVPTDNVDEFNNRVTITLNTFANMLKSGLSITETLSQMGGAFDKLIANQEALGVEGDETFETLKRFKTLIDDNKELVESVEGLNAVLEATAALGPLNQESFDAFASSATSKFDKLIEQGFSAGEALTLLGPSLKTLKEQSEKYGLELDENTKKLIAQGEEAGIFDAMADPLDRVADILGKIFVQLGGNEDELEKLGQAAITSTDEATKGLEEMNSEIEKVGDTSQNTAKTMASSMDAATESIDGDIKDLSDKTVDNLNNLADEANQTAQDMAESFKLMSEDGKESVAGLVKSALGNLNKLGKTNLGLNIQPQIPGFQHETPPGGLKVPPGNPNDSFLFAASSGERIFVEHDNSNNRTSSNSELNLNITMAVDKTDSVDEVAWKIKEAIKDNRLGVIKSIREATD